ncbi:MAG: protocatechuate 3,4-dioxygenase subunit alpha [Nocardioides sp.]|nr:protocatechuate 3,4-dioxygenase subunit alpha [Nocardioides sp.]
MSPAATPGQTIGPFYGYALPFPDGDRLVPLSHPQAVRLHGRVLDGEGRPVPDALLEIWQADADGAVAREPGSLRRDGWTFTGWGRTPTDDTGRYAFTTVVPGAADHRAPFIAMTVFARGLLNRLFTRVYLPVPGADLTHDPLLASLPPDRRDTLVATPDATGFVFDVILQGDRETVFLTHG